MSFREDFFQRATYLLIRSIAQKLEALPEEVMPDIDPLGMDFINDAISVCVIQEKEWKSQQDSRDKGSLQAQNVVEGLPPQLLGGE